MYDGIMFVEEFLLETENTIFFYVSWCTNFYDDSELLQLQT